MKNLTKSLLALLIMAIAFSTTSCLNSDDDYKDNSIKAEQYGAYLMRMAGSYEGKLRFWNDTISKENKTDSIDAYVRLTASSDTLIHTTMPANVLMKSVNDNDDLKEALGDMPLTVEMYYQLYMDVDNVVYFGVYPKDIKQSVTYGGKEHEVRFCFMNSNVNYWGAYKAGYMQLQACLSKIYLDGNLIKTFTINSSTGSPETSSIYVFDLEGFYY